MNTTPFIITGPARTGSTLLNVSLRQHPAVAMHGEVFGDGQKLHVYGLDNRVAAPLEQVLLDWRDRDGASFLRDVLLRGDGHDAVGLKFKYEELSNPRWEAVRTAIAEDSNVHIVRLRRENLFKRFVSQHKAVSVTGVFNIQGNKSLPEDPDVRIDPKEAEADFAQVRRWEATFEEEFRNHPVLDLTYETIAADPLASLHRVQEFLGLGVEDLPVRNRRLSRRPMADSVVNHDELAAHFVDTEFASFFEDADV